MKNDKGIQVVFVILLAVLIGVIIYAACCRHSCDQYDDVTAKAAERTLKDFTEEEKAVFFAEVAKVVYFRDGVLTIRREYEQETSEEAESQRVELCECAEYEVESDIPHSELPTEESESEHSAELRVEVLQTVATPQPSLTDLYPNIPTEYLTEMAARLHAYGIDWFLPYAVATMFQESRCNPNAENPNGLDKGLLQYRITYWPAVCREHGFDPNTSIFDWRVQISIYAADAARRLHSGLSVEEAVSRHNTSDYGQYNPVYVAQVMQWVR